MKYVLFYEAAHDVASKAPEFFPAHKARYESFAARGSLLMTGPFSDRDGALAIFTTREAAEEFARGDPFVLNGIVADWKIREWGEALVPEGQEAAG